jgi:hypothetical protein
MICRMWRGWTTPANAGAYDDYLNRELFPRVRADLGSRGYRGYQVLRHDGADEVEFVTMLWFESLDDVRGFAGEAYETPVISEKARTLLARWQDRCEHYQVSGLEEPS